jgi:hypothetical protein
VQPDLHVAIRSETARVQMEQRVLPPKSHLRDVNPGNALANHSGSFLQHLGAGVDDDDGAGYNKSFLERLDDVRFDDDSDFEEPSAKRPKSAVATTPAPHDELGSSHAPFVARDLDGVPRVEHGSPQVPYVAVEPDGVDEFDGLDSVEPDGVDEFDGLDSDGDVEYDQDGYDVPFEDGVVFSDEAVMPDLQRDFEQYPVDGSGVEDFTR